MRIAVLATAMLTLLLQACATPTASPGTVAAAAAPAASVPELTLNLPKKADCACKPSPVEDYTFLEKGFNRLLNGEYIEAVQYFQRYQRLESSPRADLEAGIAIAYVSMLPRSPFYDPEAARKSFVDLRRQNAKELKVHDMTRLMRQALINFEILQKQIIELTAESVTLRGDLKKREEALKRLRELTLGQ